MGWVSYSEDIRERALDYAFLHLTNVLAVPEPRPRAPEIVLNPAPSISRAVECACAERRMQEIRDTHILCMAELRPRRSTAGFRAEPTFR